MSEYKSEEWLAAVIRKYWKQRGYDIQVSPVTCDWPHAGSRLKRSRNTEAAKVKSVAKEPGTYLAVRSDLINGMPRGFRRVVDGALGAHEP